VTFQRAPRQNNCSHCHGLGYRGRVGVYEVMRVNEALASAIGKGVGTDQLRRLALGNGMRTLLGYGLGLAREGITSLDEVERVLLTDSGLEQEIRARNLTTASCRGCGAGLRDEWIDCPYCLTPRGTLQPLG
jgi:type IV pilus assembly protein PilB